MIRKLIFLPLLLLAFSLALIPACNSNDEKNRTQTSEAKDTVQSTTITETHTTVDSALSPEPTVVEQTVTKNEQPETAKEKPAALTTVPAKTTKPTVAEADKPKTETVKSPVQDLPVTTPVKDPPPPPPPVEPVVEKPAPQPAAEPTQEKWVVPAKAKATPNPVPSDKESLATGKALYAKHCASCHGKSGAGDGTKAAQLKTRLESFRTSVFQSQTDGSLFYKIWEGREDMPSYKKKIPDRDEVWSIVNYLRTFR